MDQVWFWAAAGGMTAAVAATMLLALWRGRGDPDEPADLRIYRDQLRELDRDVARGIVLPADAERIRTEVARRLLEADRSATAAAAPMVAAPRRARWLAAFIIAAVLGAGSLWTYDRLGAPGYPDIPLAARIAEAEVRRAGRPGQEAAEARFAALAPPPAVAPDPQHAALVEQLRAVVAERPDDPQGQALLARNEALLGNYAAAHRAKARLIALRGRAATAQDHAAHAELMILATGGFVSPEAEAALGRALRLDPRNPTAHYYMGLMFAQNGRFDLAFRMWRTLLEASAPADPWVPPILAQIGEVAALAGVEYTPPPGLTLRPDAGPTPEQIAAAEALAPAEREAMIRGMVEGLLQRLASEGGPPEDWARAIHALGVIGDRDRAAAIWLEAQGRFAAAPGALALIHEAAEAAGIAH
jgi:cytochrome c-type biogenesis protein CcmH